MKPVIHKMKNDKGSILILLTIILAVITVLGFTCLNITFTQYQIRKSNSAVKKAFYLSENGLNYAYLRVYELVSEAAADSVNKADEFLLTEPDDTEGASDLFYNNYKLYIIRNAVNRINSSSNPNIVVSNYRGLFIGGKLTIRVSSKYLSESGIVKITSADIIVLIPDYQKTKSGAINFSSLLYFNNFDL